LVPTHVLTGTLHRVVPTSVRHAVAVLLAEVSETDPDPKAFQQAAFEGGGADRQPLGHRIPARVVERPTPVETTVAGRWHPGMVKVLQLRGSRRMV
jgi:hypothetical protein